MKFLATLKTFSILILSSVALAHDPSHPAPDAHLVFPNNGVHAHIDWLNNGPNHEGAESFLRIQFRNAATHQPTEINALPEVSLWMTDMGHGSAPTALRREVDSLGNVVTGAYLVSNIYFVMGGIWDVRVNLKSPNVAQEMKAFKVEIHNDHDHGGHH